MGEPGFWDDQQRAAQISTEHARVTHRLERYERLRRSTRTRASCSTMDGELAAEIAASIAPLQRELERLQEEALFNGEYDAGDAVVTIHAGTGGTDAQDWAEMVLRMYLRWADERGFKTELLEASPGEEAGLKSATFTVAARTPTASSRPSAASTGSCALSPFDQAHRRHTSFAQVIVAPLLADEADVEIDEADLRIDTYRASGRRRPARQQDRLRRAHHAPAHRHRRAVPERALAVSNKQTALRSSNRGSPSCEQERARRSSRRSAARRRTRASGVKSAAMCSIRTSSSRTTAPGTRRKRAGRPRRQPRRVHPRVPARERRRKRGLAGRSATLR